MQLYVIGTVGSVLYCLLFVLVPLMLITHVLTEKMYPYVVRFWVMWTFALVFFFYRANMCNIFFQILSKLDLFTENIVLLTYCKLLICWVEWIYLLKYCVTGVLHKVDKLCKFTYEGNYLAYVLSVVYCFYVR